MRPSIQELNAKQEKIARAELKAIRKIVKIQGDIVKLDEDFAKAHDYSSIKVSIWDLTNLWVEVESTNTKHKTNVPKTLFNLWNNARYKYTKETE